MKRALKNNDTYIRHAFTLDGALTAPDSAPTVTITREDGTVLTTDAATTLVSQGVYKYKLTAATHATRVDRLTVLWECTFSTGAVTYARTDQVLVVDGFLFEAEDLRNYPELASHADYEHADLEDARDVATDLIEEFTNQAWAPSYAAETFDGNDADVLFLNHLPARSLIAVKQDGTALTLTDFVLTPSGRLTYTQGSFTSATGGYNVIVRYVHGETEANADLKRAARQLAKHLLLTHQSAIPDRARMMTTEWATFQLTTADDEHPTGLPEVDAVLRRYRVSEQAVFA